MLISRAAAWKPSGGGIITIRCKTRQRQCMRARGGGLNLCSPPQRMHGVQGWGLPGTCRGQHGLLDSRGARMHVGRAPGER